MLSGRPAQRVESDGADAVGDEHGGRSRSPDDVTQRARLRGRSVAVQVQGAGRRARRGCRHGAVERDALRYRDRVRVAAGDSDVARLISNDQRGHSASDGVAIGAVQQAPKVRAQLASPSMRMAVACAELAIRRRQPSWRDPPVMQSSSPRSCPPPVVDRGRPESHIPWPPSVCTVHGWHLAQGGERS